LKNISREKDTYKSLYCGITIFRKIPEPTLPHPPFPAFFVNGKAGKGRDLKKDIHIFPFNEKKRKSPHPNSVFLSKCFSP